MSHTEIPYLQKVISENLVPAGDGYGTNMFRVVHPLHVFKAALCREVSGERPTVWFRRKVIINLVIPKGSIVHLPKNLKMHNKCRASDAFVHSIYTQVGQDEVDTATSDWDPSFPYAKGQTVVPRKPFLKKNGICESGIHFFFNLDTALYYL